MKAVTSGSAARTEHPWDVAVVRWLLDRQPGAVVLVDASGTIVGWSAAAVHLLGAEELDGARYVDGHLLLEGEDGPRQLWLEATPMEVESGEPIGHALLLGPEDRSYLEVEDDAAAFTGDYGEGAGLVDATEDESSAEAPVAAPAASAPAEAPKVRARPGGPLDALDALRAHASRLLAPGDGQVSIVALHIPAVRRMVLEHGAAQANSLVRAVAGSLRVRLGTPVAAVGPAHLALAVRTGNEGEACERARGAVTSSTVVKTGVLSDQGIRFIGVAAEPNEGAHDLVERARQSLRRALGEPVAMSAAAHALQSMTEADRLGPLIDEALENGAISLAVQPGIPLTARAPVWAEVLMRFTDPNLAGEPVASLVSVAQRTGAIYRLGSLILARAASALRGWVAEEAPPDLVSVNVSREQLERPDLAARLSAIVAAEGLPTSAFCLEVDEAAVVGAPDLARPAMAALAAAGFRVLIDDFGTGDTGQLLSLPFSGVKIARPLLHRATLDERALKSLEGVVNTLHDLGIWTVAKGVETDAEAEVVRGLSIDVGQGYFFAHPQPVEDMPDVFRSHRARAGVAAQS